MDAFAESAFRYRVGTPVFRCFLAIQMNPFHGATGRRHRGDVGFVPPRIRANSRHLPCWSEEFRHYRFESTPFPCKRRWYVSFSSPVGELVARIRLAA